MSLNRIRGDIFKHWGNSSSGLLLLFGHSGFNNLSAGLLTFANSTEDLKNITPRSYDDKFAPESVETDKWLALVSDAPPGSDQRGLSDEAVLHVFTEAQDFCLSNGKIPIFTNGIYDSGHDGAPFRPQHFHRAAYLYVLAYGSPIHYHFVNTNEVFAD